MTIEGVDDDGDGVTVRAGHIVKKLWRRENCTRYRKGALLGEEARGWRSTAAGEEVRSYSSEAGHRDGFLEWVI